MEVGDNRSVWQEWVIIAAWSEWVIIGVSGGSERIVLKEFLMKVTTNVMLHS